MPKKVKSVVDDYYDEDRPVTVVKKREKFQTVLSRRCVSKWEMDEVMMSEE